MTEDGDLSHLDVLDVDEWRELMGGAFARVLDSGCNETHGDHGWTLIVGGPGGLLIEYVWDAPAKAKRWLRFVRLDST